MCSGSIDINSIISSMQFRHTVWLSCQIVAEHGQVLAQTEVRALVLRIASSGSLDPWRAWDGILGLGRSTIFVCRRYISKDSGWTCFSAIVGGCTMMISMMYHVDPCFGCSAGTLLLNSPCFVELAVQVWGDCKCIHCEVWKQWWAHRCSECQRAPAQGAEKETKGHVTDVLWHVATIWYVLWILNDSIFFNIS